LIFSHTSNENEEEIHDELVAEEHARVQAAIDAIPTNLSISEPSKRLGQGSSTPDTINFDYLVELRRRHQTAQAARGVRTRVVDWGSEKAKATSIRQQLIKKLHLALKEEQDHATGTGLERSARWRAAAPGGAVSGSALPGAGNSANAALAATVVAKKVSFYRRGAPYILAYLFTGSY
jgi:hypothetical protein